MTTLYETLRDDKVYRLGMRIVKKLDADNDFEEGDEARKILVSQTRGFLKPRAL